MTYKCEYSNKFPQRSTRIHGLFKFILMNIETNIMISVLTNSVQKHPDHYLEGYYHDYNKIIRKMKRFRQFAV